LLSRPSEESTKGNVFTITVMKEFIIQFVH
jgi:hypothetical protein